MRRYRTEKRRAQSERRELGDTTCPDLSHRTAHGPRRSNLGAVSCDLRAMRTSELNFSLLSIWAPDSFPLSEDLNCYLASPNALKSYRCYMFKNPQYPKASGSSIPSSITYTTTNLLTYPADKHIIAGTGVSSLSTLRRRPIPLNVCRLILIESIPKSNVCIPYDNSLFWLNWPSLVNRSKWGAWMCLSK